MFAMGAKMVPEAADFSHSASKQARGWVGRPQWGGNWCPRPAQVPASAQPRRATLLR